MWGVLDVPVDSRVSPGRVLTVVCGARRNVKSRSRICIILIATSPSSSRRCFTVTTHMDAPDMPYGEAYTTYVMYCIVPTSKHSCRISVSSEPRFHGADASGWKGKEIEGCRGCGLAAPSACNSLFSFLEVVPGGIGAVMCVYDSARLSPAIHLLLLRYRLREGEERRVVVET